ncbi:hypothetical protein WS69_10590 [Burkholderia sp. BDU5]|nr:hypothetical protein WS69_10590 [Burkholderia sp. BDU5]
MLIASMMRISQAIDEMAQVVESVRSVRCSATSDKRRPRIDALHRQVHRMRFRSSTIKRRASEKSAARSPP